MSDQIYVGVDVGGTFTDVCIWAPGVGFVTRKTPSSTNLDENALSSIAKEAIGRQLDSDDAVLVGTTAVTNALLEGNFARIGVVTTDGFRDVLEIARGSRASSFDLRRQRVAPIVRRELRFEVRERVRADGSVETELADDSVSALLQDLRDAQLDCVAICLLHSHVNDVHEQRLRAAIESDLGIATHLSSEVLPLRGEYERWTTTVINAGISHAMAGFANGLGMRDDKDSEVTQQFVMSSEGAALTLTEALHFPVKCVLSGPAGGVVASARLAADLSIAEALTMDVGGTSTDVALITDGRPSRLHGRVIGGHNVAAPSVEIETIGAGGGSIARIDHLGMLTVGPQSAGSVPGPACYGRGGTAPTVTDAHVVLGRLGVSSMVGGTFDLDIEAARSAIDEHVARPLGTSIEDAALGIIKIADFTMSQAMRRVSIERGRDPRKMSLVAFGGAGPLHAASVARLMGIPEVIVPQYPGLWSAYGVLTADVQYGLVRSAHVALAPGADSLLARTFDDQFAELWTRVKRDGSTDREMVPVRWVQARYHGHTHKLDIDIPADVQAPLTEWITQRYNDIHHERFGYSLASTIVEVVTVGAALQQPSEVAYGQEGLPQSVTATATRAREVNFGGAAPIDCAIVDRQSLVTGQRLTGPVAIEQYDSTVIAWPSDEVEVLASGALRILVDRHPEPTELES